MSDILTITELHQINSPSDIINGPEWVRYHTSHTQYGFMYAGTGFDFGNWLVRLSNGEIYVYTDAFLKMFAASLPAFKAAGLIADDLDNPQGLARFTTAFTEDTVLIYVKPDFDDGNDSGEIVVLERAPHRDPLTNIIDPHRTWVILASEYLSGQVVEGARLSVFTDLLKAARIDYRLGSRGPETV